MIAGKHHIIAFRQEEKEAEVICPWCKNKLVVRGVEGKALASWENGTLIQEAFPMLSSDARELLVSGICPKCWDREFISNAQSGSKRKEGGSK